MIDFSWVGPLAAAAVAGGTGVYMKQVIERVAKDQDDMKKEVTDVRIQHGSRLAVLESRVDRIEEDGP